MKLILIQDTPWKLDFQRSKKTGMFVIKHLLVLNLVTTFGSLVCHDSFWFSLKTQVGNVAKSNFSSAFHLTLLNIVLVQK